MSPVFSASPGSNSFSIFSIEMFRRGRVQPAREPRRIQFSERLNSSAPIRRIWWVGSETERVVFFLFHVSLATLISRWKRRALLFFIEIKAVQDAMGKRSYDHGRYSDKSQSGKQSVTGSKYFGA
jgi:hypothetical protein